MFQWPTLRIPYPLLTMKRVLLARLLLVPFIGGLLLSPFPLTMQVAHADAVLCHPETMTEFTVPGASALQAITDPLG